PNEAFGASVEVWGSFHETAIFDEITIGAPEANGGRGSVYVIYGEEDLPSEFDFNNGDEPDIIII
ncbi:MAG: hypothetical protein GTO02_17270, partial [Candidatus Dadabacteria bacterium]|nr:hypothetical protein [Candidatus Dadabacteria bacterium]NIQ16071.1 hypothetical protein [Candidatus Dadabacteria bacterium]